jgi:Bacteriophage T4-like portal protein (Gp20)
LAISLLGFELRRKTDEEKKKLISFSPPENEDGSMVVQAVGGGYGTYADLEAAVRSEAELVIKYRQLALQPEIDAAIDEVVNESIVQDDEQEVVSIDLDDVEDMPDPIKEGIIEEFKGLLSLFEFDTHAYEVFKRWYIDGRMYWHIIVDKDNLQEGIKELRWVDPRKIRKIKEVVQKRGQGQGSDVKTGADLYKVVNEYYIYSERGFTYGVGQGFGRQNISPTMTGVKIAKDAIVHATSGLVDENGTLVLSYLHKAIKVMNQLRAVEDAVIIYRLVRAPERRVWYIDVGNLPKAKAEQYMRDIMVRHKNRLMYDSSTGAIKQDPKFMTLYEDFWLARREGGRGTEVTTLPAGELAGRLDDVVYFQKRLYKSLNVPLARLMPEDLYVTGRSSEITREEVNFSRFIDRLRKRFAQESFNDAMCKQLALKGVMDPDEWDHFAHKIKYRWARDNFFSELKDNEVLRERLDTLAAAMPFVGRYMSNEQVRKNILRQTDDDMKEIDEQIAAEADNPQYQLQPEEMPEMGQGGEPGQPDTSITPPDQEAPPGAPRANRK